MPPPGDGRPAGASPARARRLVAASLGIAAGIFGFTAGTGLTRSWLAATLLGALAAGLVFALIEIRRLVPLDLAACSRGLKILAAVATPVALLQLARLAVFTIDPSEVGFSIFPSSKWELEHSCLSAYFVAGQAVSSTPNVYDNRLYSLPDDDPTQRRSARRIGPFKVDVFEYPPQFLLLPRALHLLTPDFLDLRKLWFALSGSVLLLTFLAVARFLGPAAGTRTLLLSPLVWAALPTLGTLQKGNVQVIVIAASLLAMVLFERRRWAAGGALLAFVTVSKLFPGLLIVYLLARRQWRAMAWTAAWGIAFNVLTLVAFGWAPYAAFLDHLPGLVGGEAFPAFRSPAAMAINYSIPGLVFKLKLFGVPGMSFGAAKLVGWVYTLVALAVTFFAGRRVWRDGEKAPVWMAILVLASLRSPFLPQAYAAFPPLWLLTLLAATWAPMIRRPALILIPWAALNIYWPLDWPLDPRWMAIANGVPQALTVALVVLALWHRRQPPEDGVPVSRA